MPFCEVQVISHNGVGARFEFDNLPQRLTDDEVISTPVGCGTSASKSAGETRFGNGKRDGTACVELIA